MSHLGDQLNKAQLFYDNLATNPVLAAKIIPILVDFAAKMEELLDDMRSLFDGLGPKVNQEVPLENVPDISLEIGNFPSLTGWRWQVAPTETPKNQLNQDLLSQPRRQRKKSPYINQNPSLHHDNR